MLHTVVLLFVFSPIRIIGTGGCTLYITFVHNAGRSDEERYFSSPVTQSVMRRQAPTRCSTLARAARLEFTRCGSLNLRSYGILIHSLLSLFEPEPSREVEEVLGVLGVRW